MNLFSSPPTLEGSRIQLIPMELTHAQALWEVNDLDNWNFMTLKVDSKEKMLEWVRRAIEQRKNGTALPFVVVVKSTGRIIGASSLFQISLSQKSCEVGSTWYSKSYQRTFVNTECKLALLDYCFNELECIRVQIKTDERNLRSQQAIERLGAKREGILRKERILESGYSRNAVLYSIIDEEWPAVCEHLVNKLASY
ncbi:hypothetical protein Q73_15295 [Bacillus coahuilensis m2-6]|uniref:GNAT family N-acetyltransferase n=1 Tax=Bacillus coahuilensis TaxID=408580 RepID=UPI0007504E41|nr:GNAT family protein [Bacillus coahuilensis]KUP04494.1 hypothetical protein Q73_15295 [Bacillus coahuilensis m2-6]